MNIILFDADFFYGSDKSKLSLPASDERADHISRILKLYPGDTFKAGIVDGPVGEMRVEEYERRDADGRSSIRLNWTETGPPLGLYPLILLVGYTRPISAKRILREAASLGLKHIVFTGTEKGEKSYREAKLWKERGWRRFLIDGLQQAGGTVLPRVYHARNAGEALKTAEEAASGGGPGEGGLNRGKPDRGELNRGKPDRGGVFRILLDNEIGETRLSTLDLRAPSCGTEGETADGAAGAHVILAVGSERGWTERERNRFVDFGYLPAKLGSRVLRTETACAAGSALSLSRMGIL
ncbi:MAG: RsmE family RNA methyltransferase [Spirochaetia bacterium]